MPTPKAAPSKGWKQMNAGEKLECLFKQMQNLAGQHSKEIRGLALKLEAAEKNIKSLQDHEEKQKA